MTRHEHQRILDDLSTGELSLLLAQDPTFELPSGSQRRADRMAAARTAVGGGDQRMTEKENFMHSGTFMHSGIIEGPTETVPTVHPPGNEVLDPSPETESAAAAPATASPVVEKPVKARRSKFGAVRCVETGVEYLSASAAARAVGSYSTAITSAIVRGGECGGYHWERIDSATVASAPAQAAAAMHDTPRSAAAATTVKPLVPAVVPPAPLLPAISNDAELLALTMFALGRGGQPLALDQVMKMTAELAAAERLLRAIRSQSVALCVREGRLAEMKTSVSIEQVDVGSDGRAAEVASFREDQSPDGEPAAARRAGRPRTQPVGGVRD